MDEFKEKSIQKNCGFDKPNHYDDMWYSNPKKYGRKAARRNLKNSIQDIYSEMLWSWNEDCYNTWDDRNWDECDYGHYDTEVINHQNMMDWTNDAIRF